MLSLLRGGRRDATPPIAEVLHTNSSSRVTTVLQWPRGGRRRKVPSGGSYASVTAASPVPARTPSPIRFGSHGAKGQVIRAFLKSRCGEDGDRSFDVLPIRGAGARMLD